MTKRVLEIFACHETLSRRAKASAENHEGVRETLACIELLTTCENKQAQSVTLRATEVPILIGVLTLYLPQDGRAGRYSTACGCRQQWQSYRSVCSLQSCAGCLLLAENREVP